MSWQDAELTAFFEEMRRQKRQTLELSLEEPVGGERITFGYYVSKPAIFFGMATFVAVGGISVAGIVYLDLLKVPYAPLVGVGLALGWAGIVSGYAAYLLTDDWRQYQYQYTTTRTAPAERKPDPRGRIIEPVSVNTRAVTRCDWQPDWRQALAKRCLNQYGEWKVTENISRRLLGKKEADPRDLYKSLTEMYDAAKKDLQDVGIIDEYERFTVRGKAELKDALFITSADSDRFPYPEYDGPVVW